MDHLGKLFQGACVPPEARGDPGRRHAFRAARSVPATVATGLACHFPLERTIELSRRCSPKNGAASRCRSATRRVGISLLRLREPAGRATRIARPTGVPRARWSRGRIFAGSTPARANGNRLPRGSGRAREVVVSKARCSCARPSDFLTIRRRTGLTRAPLVAASLLFIDIFIALHTLASHLQIGERPEPRRNFHAPLQICRRRSRLRRCTGLRATVTVNWISGVFNPSPGVNVGRSPIPRSDRARGRPAPTPAASRARRPPRRDQPERLLPELELAVRVLLRPRAESRQRHRVHRAQRRCAQRARLPRRGERRHGRWRRVRLAQCRQNKNLAAAIQVGIWEALYDDSFNRQTGALTFSAIPAGVQTIFNSIVG